MCYHLFDGGLLLVPNHGVFDIDSPVMLLHALYQATEIIKLDIDGLVQDCSISSALAMEILQSCSKSSISVTWNRICELLGGLFLSYTTLENIHSYILHISVSLPYIFISIL